MIDVVNPKCNHDGCTRQPTYNYIGEKRGIYCSDHALLYMIDVVNRKCTHDNCTITPIFNYLGESRGIYCKKHALTGMIDVVNPKCNYNGCTSTSPTFNYPNETKGLYCTEHAFIDMIDVVNKKCSLCKLTQCNYKYKPYCTQCFYYLHPDDERVRHYKTKEQSFTFPLQKLYPNCVLDRVIKGGCSKRRPDFLLDVITHSVIVEVDENQHITYDDKCENGRLEEIWGDLGSRPLVVIRVNPDKYTLNDEKHLGCFTTKMKIKRKEHNLRLQKVISEVEHYIANPVDKHVHVVSLFMDN